MTGAARPTPRRRNAAPFSCRSPEKTPGSLDFQGFRGFCTSLPPAKWFSILNAFAIKIYHWVVIKGSIVRDKEILLPLRFRTNHGHSLIYLSFSLIPTGGTPKSYQTTLKPLHLLLQLLRNRIQADCFKNVRYDH